MGNNFHTNFLRKIKRALNIIRKSLFEVKIFLDTIIVVIFTIIGIKVSITENKIAELQTEIIQKQTEIEYQSNLPLIDLEIDYNKDGNINKLSVQNQGGALNWYVYDILPVVEYKYITGLLKSQEEKIVEVYNTDTDSVRIPVNMFYEGTSLFKSRKFHTIDGLLFEVYTNDWVGLMNNASKQIVSTRQKNDGDAALLYKAPIYSQNDDNTVTIYTEMSLGYILQIQYSSKLDATDGISIDDLQNKTYLVLTGEGYPSQSIFVNETQNAFSIIKQYKSENPYKEIVFLTGDSLKDANTLNRIFTENRDKYLPFSTQY